MTNAVALAATDMPLRLAEIEVPETARSCHPDTVTNLARSIADIGLQTPPTVVQRDGRYVLVAGRHRIEALKSLSVEHVPVRLVEMDDVDARMWAISENLHRAELTELQRDEQIAEYADLAEKKREAELHSAQVAQNESKRADNRGHRHEGGDARAARDLGLKRDKVRRAKKITALSEEAKQAARDAGLDDNQSALLKAAKASTPEAQVAELRAIHERGRVADVPRHDGDTAQSKAHQRSSPSSTRRETPVNSDDAIGELARELISKCRGAKAEYRTLDKMSWIVPAAKTAIAQALQRLDGAVKTREGERGIEYRIEGNPDMLLARAAVKTEPSDRSAAAADAEIDQLRAENADLRAKLDDANDEIEKLHAEIGRLKSALHEKVVEEIAAKLVAQGETKPTEDDVVRAAHLAPRMRSASQKPEGCSGDS